MVWSVLRCISDLLVVMSLSLSFYGAELNAADEPALAEEEHG